MWGSRKYQVCVACEHVFIRAERMDQFIRMCQACAKPYILKEERRRDVLNFVRDHWEEFEEIVKDKQIVSLHEKWENFIHST